MNKKVLGLSAVLLSTNLITTSTLSSFSRGTDFDQGAKSVASDFLSQFDTSSTDPFVLLRAVLVYQDLDDEIRQLIDLSLPATGSNHRLIDLLANAIILFNQTNTDPDRALDLSNAVQLVRYELPPVFINPNIEAAEPEEPQESEPAVENEQETSQKPDDPSNKETKKPVSLIDSSLDSSNDSAKPNNGQTDSSAQNIKEPESSGSSVQNDSAPASQETPAKENTKKPSVTLIDSSLQESDKTANETAADKKLDEPALDKENQTQSGNNDNPEKELQEKDENGDQKDSDSDQPDDETDSDDKQDENQAQQPQEPDFSEEKEIERQRMEQLKQRFFTRFFEQSDPLAALEIQLSMGVEMQDFSQELKDYLEEAFFEAYGYSMMDFFEQQIRGLYELSKTNEDFLPVFTRLYEQNKDCPVIAELFLKLDPILIQTPEIKEPEPAKDEPEKEEPEEEKTKDEKKDNPSSNTEVVERRLTPSFGGFKSLSQRADRTITLWPGKEIQLLPDFNNSKAWKGSASPYNTPTLWGQCTWFAWGRFYEIYGFSPGFTGNGYECVGQLIAAHPSLFSLSKKPVPGAVFSSDPAHNHVGIVLEVDEENNKLTIQEGNLDAISNPLWSDAIEDWRTIVLSLDQLRDLYGNVVFANPANLRSLQDQKETTQARQDTLADPKALNQALPELAIDRYKTQL